MARSRLVLPLPEGPTSATSSPGAQSNAASSRIGRSLLNSSASLPIAG
jgi:hypothetical protein